MSHVPKILIVEDQYLVAHDCEFHLRSAGFNCVGLASTAEEALQLAEREQPDVVIMDVRLATRTDGVQAAIDIFRRFGIRSIFTSGHADAATREQAVPANPIGWLDKPYTSSALIDAVAIGIEQVGVHERPAEAAEDDVRSRNTSH
jgi:two-component system, response regulator PdtaR